MEVDMKKIKQGLWEPLRKYIVWFNWEAKGGTKSKPKHSLNVSKSWCAKRNIVLCLYIKNASSYHRGILEEGEKIHQL